MLALSERLNSVCVPSSNLKTETDPVPETLCFLIICNSGRRTKFIKISDSECYTPLSEPFKFVMYENSACKNFFVWM
jgi:hypothetical protein